MAPATDLRADTRPRSRNMARRRTHVHTRQSGIEFGWTRPHSVRLRGKRVRCERCGREFVVTPWDDFYCTEADHCCEACLLVGHPGPLILLDPDGDVSRLGRTGSPDAPSRGEAR